MEHPDCEICILAGGLSSRMGRDKSRLRLGNKTLLGHVRAAAESTGLPTRVIRRDLVARCGPLGGVYTALKTTRAPAVLFLACDMPFVSREAMAFVRRQLSPRTKAVFSLVAGSPGFPFMLRAACLDAVERQLAGKQFALRALAGRLEARTVSPPRALAFQFTNVNTPQEWETAREFLRGR